MAVPGIHRIHLNLRHDEESLKEFKADALRKCDDKVREFVDCCKAHTFGVIFRCRGENKAMNSCLGQYTTKEIKEEYRLRKWLEVRDWEGYDPVRAHNESFVPPEQRQAAQQHS